MDASVSLKEPLIAAVARAPRRLGFFALVDLMDRLLPASARPGSDGACTSERIAFRSAQSLRGAAPDVIAVESRTDRSGAVGSVVVETSFLGLTGVSSPMLEGELTDQLLHDDEDGVLRATLDAIQGRLLGLLFRAWRSHRPLSVADLPTNGSRPQTLPLALRALSMNGRDPALDEPSLGALPEVEAAVIDLRRGRPATTDFDVAERLLRLLLNDLPLRLIGATARRVAIPEEDQAVLGAETCVLGEAVYGDAILDAAARVRIEVGPIDVALFESLTPGGARYARVRDLARGILGRAREVELDLLLAPEDAPCVVLGAERGADLGADARVTLGSQEPLRARVVLTDDAADAAVEYVDDR